MPCHAMPYTLHQAAPCRAMPCWTKLRHAMLHQAAPCHASALHDAGHGLPCCTMPTPHHVHAMLCCPMPCRRPCHVSRNHAKLRQAAPGHANPCHANPHVHTMQFPPVACRATHHHGASQISHAFSPAHACCRLNLQVLMDQSNSYGCTTTRTLATALLCGLLFHNRRSWSSSASWNGQRGSTANSTWQVWRPCFVPMLAHELGSSMWQLQQHCGACRIASALRSM